ncbi:MAG: PKD domain-containing protein [Vicingaceae bacterium]
MRNFILLLLLPFLFSWTMAQSNLADTANYPYWIEMMQDPSSNFFENQRAFELYWQNRERDKADGWKIFKRWEYHMESRVDRSGKKPKPDEVLKEQARYFSTHAKAAGAVNQDHWNEVGPIAMPSNGTGQPNGLGRVNCLAFHPSNSDIFYAGAPAGGLWKTEDGGSNWEILTDTLPTLGVSSIVLDYSNPNTLYLGTGDRDGADAPGLGVWKSVDAGLTWAPSNTGMGNRVIGKMIMNPLDSSVLIAATSAGIYKSADKGQNWVRKTTNTSFYKDICYKPGDTNIVYSTANGNFYRSTNGGENWTQVSSGLTSSNRMVIGVSPANANYVYLVLTNTRTFKGLYRSTNSGQSFTLMSSTPNIMDYSANGSGTSGQAWYDLCVAVDPQNANVLYVAGVNIWKSTNGGSSWSLKAHWTFGASVPGVHADHHDLLFSPSDGKLYNGNDGGVYVSSNGGTAWSELSSGLSIAQIYKIGQSAQSNNLTINGYQDNGTAIYDGSWRTEIGGDGMECIIDPTDSNYMYGALYYGNIRRSTNNGLNFSGNIAGGVNESGEWVTPYVLKEGDPDVMISGFKNVWISSNIKASSTSSITWTKVSNNLGNSNSAGIRVLENSPVDNEILYISREDNKLFRSDNIGNSSPVFTNISASLPTSTWPRDIEAHPTDVNKVYIVQSNKVYESNNKGLSWTNITGSLPNVSMNCIVYDTSSSGNLYVGSDLGVFFKGSWMTDWIPFNGGLPYTAEVTELEIYYDGDMSDSRIKAATYGRGLWSSPLYQQLAADFEANENQICVGQTVVFSDLSDGFYTNVSWDFPGGTPTSSTLNSPSITYANPGIYSVSLKISNASEADSTLKTGYITVDSMPVITVNPSAVSINKGDSIVLTASGAITYTWSPINGLNVFKGAIVIASPQVSTTYTVSGANNFCAMGSGTAQSVITVITTGLDESAFAGGTIRIFPNPADDLIIMTYSNLKVPLEKWTLFDQLGRKQAEQLTLNKDGNGTLTIPSKSLPNGQYLLRLTAENGEASVVKILIDHPF